MIFWLAPRVEDPNKEVVSTFCVDLTVVEAGAEDLVLLLSLTTDSGRDKDSVIGRQYIRFAR